MPLGKGMVELFSITASCARSWSWRKRHAARRELAMQHEAQRPRLVTGDEAKAAGELTIDPAQKVRGLETLRWFGMHAFLLDGRDVKSQMHIEGDLEQRLEWRWNLSLSCTSNAGRTGVVIIHMGRQCGTRVRPVSALMFSNERSAEVQ
jgi:hypothetical protein